MCDNALLFLHPHCFATKTANTLFTWISQTSGFQQHFVHGVACGEKFRVLHLSCINTANVKLEQIGNLQNGKSRVWVQVNAALADSVDVYKAMLSPRKQYLQQFLGLKISGLWQFVHLHRFTRWLFLIWQIYSKNHFILRDFSCRILLQVSKASPSMG